MTKREAFASLLAGVLFSATVSAASAADAPPPQAAPAAEPLPDASLLFSPAEVVAIRRALNHTATAADEQASVVVTTVPNIHVSAIADLGDGHWTVWANGWRITPGHQPPGFQVVSVHDDEVDLIVDDGPGVRVRLHPSQTWRAAYHDVVEGIVR